MSSARAQKVHGLVLDEQQSGSTEPEVMAVRGFVAWWGADSGASLHQTDLPRVGFQPVHIHIQTRHHLTATQYASKWVTAKELLTHLRVADLRQRLRFIHPHLRALFQPGKSYRLAYARWSTATRLTKQVLRGSRCSVFQGAGFMMALECAVSNTERFSGAQCVELAVYL